MIEEKLFANGEVDNTPPVEESYKAEVQKLKLFSSRWSVFVNQTVKKYPSDATRKLVAVSEMITEILLKDDLPDYTDKQKIEDVYKIIEKEGDFAPIQNAALFGESDNGFNMEEVLNPKGELDLMSLCKELGVTE